MSRNLGLTSCADCGGEVQLAEAPRRPAPERFARTTQGRVQAAMNAHREAFAAAGVRLGWRDDERLEALVRLAIEQGLMLRFDRLEGDS